MYNKIIVIGDGLLGSHIAKRYPHVPIINHATCDITSAFDIDAVMRHHNPEIVINCAGLLNKNEHPDLKMLEVNARGPRLLQNTCDEIGAKLIQISTNCVFQGTRGFYSEVDTPDPQDIYGMSKYLGEITEFPHITVRASFVGFPDSKGRGLFAWASNQRTITGFDNYLWNGITAWEFARVLFEIIIPRGLSHITHVVGQETLSKYDMLVQAKEVFGWDYSIIKESDVVAEEKDRHVFNHTLSSEFADMLTVKKSFKEMLQEMKNAWNA